MTINEFGRRSLVTWTATDLRKEREAKKEIQMRQYRGLTKEGKWVYGNLIYLRHADNRESYFIQEIEGTYYGAEVEPYNRGWSHNKFEVIPKTVGQETGHKKCYEGDIVSNGDNYPSVIEWQCNPDQDEFIGFYLHEIYPKGEPDRFHSFFAYTTPLEVIGNIHQNPKLMEQPK